MSFSINDLPCNFDWDTKRNTYSAIASGFLFFFGWWIMIDTAIIHSTNWSNWYFVLTIVGTLTMFMVNVVSNSVVQGNSMDEGICGEKGARLWLMLGFIGSFACIVAAIWIMFADYVLPKDDASNWPGVALFLQASMIFLASLTYKFGRTEELWD